MPGVSDVTTLAAMSILLAAKSWNAVSTLATTTVKPSYRCAANTEADYGKLNGLARQSVKLDLIAEHWDDLLRLAGYRRPASCAHCKRGIVLPV